MLLFRRIQLRMIESVRLLSMHRPVRVRPTTESCLKHHNSSHFIFLVPGNYCVQPVKHGRLGGWHWRPWRGGTAQWEMIGKSNGDFLTCVHYQEIALTRCSFSICVSSSLCGFLLFLLHSSCFAATHYLTCSCWLFSFLSFVQFLSPFHPSTHPLAPFTPPSSRQA